MSMIATAEAYLAANNLKGRTPVHHCSRWQRITGISDPAAMTTDAIVDYREKCVELGYSPVSIEHSISDVILITRIATGRRVDPGRRLRRTRSRPTPAAVDDLSAVYLQSPAWVRQWMALSYWTCLRLQDSLELQQSIRPVQQSVLEWTASKTQQVHRFPIPVWLQRHIVMQVQIPAGKTVCRLQDKLRAALTRASTAAGVPRLLPRLLRQRAITEWMRADGTAGRLVHGCGLGVLDHYVDSAAIIEQHMHKVRLPDCFATAEERQQQADISIVFGRLDPEAKQLVRSTIRRLA